MASIGSAVRTIIHWSLSNDPDFYLLPSRQSPTFKVNKSIVSADQQLGIMVRITLERILFIDLLPLLFFHSCSTANMFSNPSGNAQWWSSPTAAPTYSPDARQLSDSDPHIRDGLDDLNSVVEEESGQVGTDSGLSLQMWGANNTWFSHDKYGASYDFTSANGNILYFEGTLCPAAASEMPSEDASGGQEESTVEGSHAETTRGPDKTLPSSTRPRFPKPKPMPAYPASPWTTTDVINPFFDSYSYNANKNTAVAAHRASRLRSRRSLQDNGNCPIAPGLYKLRVVSSTSYAYSEDVLWKFCGASGHARDELLFRVSDTCTCSPVTLQNVTEVCVSEARSPDTVITLQGTLVLGGLQGQQQITDTEMAVIQRTLAKEFSESGIGHSVDPQGDVEMLTWTWNLQEGANTGRSLSERQTSISFRVKTYSRHLGSLSDSVRSDEDVARLVDSMRDYLREKMTSGAFTAKIHSEALSAQQRRLMTVNFADLVELQMFHESKINKQLSVFGNSVLIIEFIFGSLFFAGLVISYFHQNRRQQGKILQYTRVETEVTEVDVEVEAIDQLLIS